MNWKSIRSGNRRSINHVTIQNPITSKSPHWHRYRQEWIIFKCSRVMHHSCFQTAWHKPDKKGLRRCCVPLGGNKISWQKVEHGVTFPHSFVSARICLIAWNEWGFCVALTPHFKLLRSSLISLGKVQAFWMLVTELWNNHSEKGRPSWNIWKADGQMCRANFGTYLSNRVWNCLLCSISLPTYPNFTWCSNGLYWEHMTSNWLDNNMEYFGFRYCFYTLFWTMTS